MKQRFLIAVSALAIMRNMGPVPVDNEDIHDQLEPTDENIQAITDLFDTIDAVF